MQGWICGLLPGLGGTAPNYVLIAWQILNIPPFLGAPVMAGKAQGLVLRGVCCQGRLWGLTVALRLLWCSICAALHLLLLGCECRSLQDASSSKGQKALCIPSLIPQRFLFSGC